MGVSRGYYEPALIASVSLGVWELLDGAISWAHWETMHEVQESPFAYISVVGVDEAEAHGRKIPGVSVAILLLIVDKLSSMPLESVLGARLLLSATVGYAKGKYQRMAFMDEAVEHAAIRVAKRHDGLEPEVFPAAFEKDEVKTLIDRFDGGGDPITVESVAETLNEEMLDPDLDADQEELVTEFFTYLEQEISQDEELGRKLQTVYAQRLYEYATRLREGQEELLEQIEVVGEDRSGKGYDVFMTVDDRFDQQLAGEHPRQRFDLPFYGRTNMVDEVIEFADSDNEVLVVHGPAGIGKTRLVVEASFQLQAVHPEWTVYTANVHADLDVGLSEIEFDEEDGIILFIDDARDADQLERVFDFAAQRRSQVKLVFTDRSIFASALEDRANRFGLDAAMLSLSPLDAETVTNIIRDAYGIQDPQSLEWIVQVSEGKPLIAHLLADQIVSDGPARRDPVAAEDTVLEQVFDDVIRDIRRAAEQQGVGDPQKLESYFRHVAAVGTLDTGNEAFMDTFREALSLEPDEERRYREILLDAVGTIDQRSEFLEVQPDALQEYVVYDTFFRNGARDYMDAVYDAFSEFTEGEQMNNLLVIENRYDCREAGGAIDAILSDHMDRMEDYPITDRVRLLRRLELLGTASPARGVELVEAALTTEPPEDETESEGLQRRIVKAPSDIGQLHLAAISVLGPGLLKEPERIVDVLLTIALVDGVSPEVADTVFQRLNQTLRPGFSRPPASQQQVIQHISDYLLDQELDTAFRMELLEAVASASSEQAEDFSMDPVDTMTGRIRRGLIWQSDAMQGYRLAAVDALIAVIEESEDHTLKVNAAGELPSFVLAQKRYQGAQDEVFNREELERIYEFAIDHTEAEEDLDCLSELHQLVDYAEDGELSVEELGQQLEDALLDHDRYQIFVHMAPRGRDWEESEEEIRGYIRDLEPEWEEQFAAFADVVKASPETSFKRFFKLFGEEQPAAGVQLLEEPPAVLNVYREQVVVGICVGDPETGRVLVTEYIETGPYDLACAGLQVFINTDRDFAVSSFDRIIAETDRFTEERILHLSSVLRGQWEEDLDWAEDRFLTLLHESESVTPPVLNRLLDALPHREEDLSAVDDAVLEEIMNYVAEFDRLGEPHHLQQMVAEFAERDPLAFIEFCSSRADRLDSHLDLLPLHMDVDRERMRQSEDYDAAVQTVGNLVLDTDEYAPQAYSRLFHTVPVEDVAPLLADRVSTCSEDQLLRIIWYCQLFELTDPVETLLLTVMSDGVDNLRDAEAIQRNILCAISSSSMGTAAVMNSDQHQRELAVVRNWQDNSDLPVEIRNFAREAEQHLLDDLDQQARFEEEFF